MGSLVLSIRFHPGSQMAKRLFDAAVDGRCEGHLPGMKLCSKRHGPSVGPWRLVLPFERGSKIGDALC